MRENPRRTFLNSIIFEGLDSFFFYHRHHHCTATLGCQLKNNRHVYITYILYIIYTVSKKYNSFIASVSCVYLYTHTHTHIYIYIYIYIYTLYLYVHVHIYMCVCVVYIIYTSFLLHSLINVL